MAWGTYGAESHLSQQVHSCLVSRGLSLSCGGDGKRLSRESLVLKVELVRRSSLSRLSIGR